MSSVPDGHRQAMATIDTRLQMIRDRANRMKFNIRSLAREQPPKDMMPAQHEHPTPALRLRSPHARKSVLTPLSPLDTPDKSMAAAAEHRKVTAGIPAHHPLTKNSPLVRNSVATPLSPPDTPGAPTPLSPLDASPGSSGYSNADLQQKLARLRAARNIPMSEMEQALTPDIRPTEQPLEQDTSNSEEPIRKPRYSRVLDDSGVYKGPREVPNLEVVEESVDVSVLDDRIDQLLNRNRRLRSNLDEPVDEDEYQTIIPESSSLSPLPSDVPTLNIDKPLEVDPLVPVIEKNAAKIARAMENIRKSRMSSDEKQREQDDERQELILQFVGLSESIDKAERNKKTDILTLERAKAASAAIEESLSVEKRKHLFAFKDLHEFCSARGVPNPFQDSLYIEEEIPDRDIDLQYAKLVEEVQISKTVAESGAALDVDSAFVGLLNDAAEARGETVDTSIVQVVGLPPQPFRVLYDYDPFKDSPNNTPQQELPLTKGEIINVTSELSADGFYVGEKTNQYGTVVTGLVPHPFVEEVKPGEENDEIVDDFVVVVAPDKEEAEEALDYIVVGKLSTPDKLEANRLTAQQQAAARIAKTKRALTSDGALRKRLSKLKEMYEPMVISRDREKPAYGARPPPFEKFIVNGTKLSIWNHGKLMVVRDGNSWVPFDKFFRKFAIINNLNELQAASQDREDIGPKIESLGSKLKATKRDLNRSARKLKTDVKLEQTKSLVLKEKIANTKASIAEERDHDSTIIVAMQDDHASLAQTHKEIQKSPRNTKHMRTPTKLRQHGNKASKGLTVDEAIAMMMMDVLEARPDTVFKPGSTSGNFRTYSINGQNYLLGLKGGQVMIRRSQERDWVDIWTIFESQDENAERMAGMQEKIMTSRMARAKVAKLDKEDAELADAERKYRELTNSYHRTQTRVASAQTQRVTEVNKEATAIARLDAELRHLQELQSATRQRNKMLLDSMEKKNHELLHQITEAEQQVTSEADTDNNLKNILSIDEMHKQAQKARQEFELLKASSPTKSPMKQISLGFQIPTLPPADYK